MEFAFIIDNGNLVGDEQELFFQNDPVTFVLAETTTMPGLLVECGFFASKTQARKAGWAVEVPEGFFDKVIGKKRHRLTTFLPTLANLD